MTIFLEFTRGRKIENVRILTSNNISYLEFNQINFSLGDNMITNFEFWTWLLNPKDAKVLSCCDFKGLI